MNYQKCETQNSPRIHHHRLDKDYSVLANHGVENPNLSYAAKGLLWYMLSRESTFEIHTWHLSKIYIGKKRGNSRDAVQILLKELQEQGYLTHQVYKNEKGQWQHRYDIYPLPHSEFKIKFPEQDKALPDKAVPVNCHVLPITELPITEQHVLFVKESSPVAPLPMKKNTKKQGQEEQMPRTKENLYAQCVLNKKDWVKEEIEEAWKILEEYPSPVTNWFNFCDGTIKNLRKMHKIKQIDENKSCQNSEEKLPLKKPLFNIKEKTSETDTAAHPLANWRQEMGWEK